MWKRRTNVSLTFKSQKHTKWHKSSLLIPQFYGLKNIFIISSTEFELNEFEPRLIYTKNWFELSAGLNLETLNTIIRGTNHIWLKLFKFSLRIPF